MCSIKSICKHILHDKDDNDDDGDDKIRGPDRYLHISVQMMMVVVMMVVIMKIDPEVQANTHESVFIETLLSTVEWQKHPKAKTIQTSHSQIEE